MEACEATTCLTMLLAGRTAIIETLLDAGMDPNCFDGATGETHLSCPIKVQLHCCRELSSP